MSPYLKPFVVARINPIRFSKATEFGVDEVMDKMTSVAGRFASARKMWPGPAGGLARRSDARSGVGERRSVAVRARGTQDKSQYM
jgi:hypothetical protein